jgi:hypothetical protein
MPPSPFSQRVDLSKVLKRLPPGTDPDTDELPEFDINDVIVKDKEGHMTSLLLAKENTELTIFGRLEYDSSLDTAKLCPSFLSLPTPTI